MPRRLILGAVVGAVSTIAALAGYSLVRAAGGFPTGGQHRGAVSMMMAAVGNRWFLLGALGGAALGGLGSLLAARRQWEMVAAVVASLLVLEPATRIIWAITRGEAARTMVPSPAVWALEVLCGCAAGVGFWLRRVRQRRS